jgi:hypothetical protein
MITQTALVREYLESFGSITASEAQINLGIQRLAAVIHALKKNGMNIGMHRERSAGWSGKATSHARYTWVK